MRYLLEFDCPFPFPEHSDAAALPPLHRPPDLDQETPDLSLEWIRSRYLATLYGSLHPVTRLDEFAQSLRCWLPPIPFELLNACLEPLGAMDQKWRYQLPALFVDDQLAKGHLPLDEQNALDKAHHSRMQRNVAGPLEKESGWRIVTLKEWLNSLELIAHQLQILLIAEILSQQSPHELPRDQPISDGIDYEESFDLLTDRLAMHQALNGISSSIAKDGDGRPIAQLDEVQSFWKDVFVKHYGHIFPFAFMAMHAEKIFNEPLATDHNQEAEQMDSLVTDRDSFQATPDLVKLARQGREQQEATAQFAAAAEPASPTLAKLLGRNGGGKASKLKRAASTSTLAFASRQVKMGASRAQSVGPSADLVVKKEDKARVSKRKQASPRKRTAIGARTLVAATPVKTFARSASAPNMTLLGAPFRQDGLPDAIALVLQTPEAPTRLDRSWAPPSADRSFDDLGQTPMKE